MDESGLTLRAAYPQALATLTRLVGRVDVAEDALQDAAVQALAHWRDHGIPDLPAAWLVRTARNRLIDQYRRNKLAQFEMTARTVVHQQIANGSTVARVFDFELSAPVKTTIPMAEWIEVESGRITSARLFYDPALFPKP